MARDPKLWPFNPASIWNQPISTTAAYSAPAVSVGTIAPMQSDFTYIFMDPSQPPTAVKQNTSNTDCTGGSSLGTWPLNTTTPVGGTDQAPGGHNNGAAFIGTDGLSRTEGAPFVWCAGQASPTNGNMTIEPTDITGDGVSGSRGGSKLSILGGTIRRGDLTTASLYGGAAAGYTGSQIGPAHALAFNFFGDVDSWPCQPNGTNGGATLPLDSKFPNGYRWPAGRHDGAGYSPGQTSNQDMVMGALLAIQPSDTVASLGLTTTPGRMLFWTLQNFGCYIVNDTTRSTHSFTPDTNPEVGTGITMASEFASFWGATYPGIQFDGRINSNTAWSNDLAAIMAALRVVTSNTATTIGGGPAPYMQPLAPAFGSGGSAPATPTGFASSNITKTGCTLTWNASAGATSYVVTEDGAALPSILAPTTTLVLNNLTAATNYFFTVSAVNSSGSSAPTSTLVVTTLGTISGGTPPMDNVVFIILENTSLSTVMADLSLTPYLAGLISTWAGCSNYVAVGSPSAPNYLALMDGQVEQQSSDGYNLYNLTNIVDLLETAGVSWGGYAENLPSTWYTQPNVNTTLFATRHFTFGWYSDITTNSTRMHKCYDYSTFVPGRERFQWITPNLKDDAHTPGWGSGGAQNCDAWLSTAVPQILNSAAFSAGKKAILCITFDEPGGGGAPLMCLFIGPGAKQHFSSSVKYTHYSMLATWEAVLGLGNLGRFDATAPVMNDMLVGQTNVGNGGTTSMTAKATSGVGSWPVNKSQLGVVSLTAIALSGVNAWPVNLSAAQGGTTSMTAKATSGGASWPVSETVIGTSFPLGGYGQFALGAAPLGGVAPRGSGGTPSLTASADSTGLTWAASASVITGGGGAVSLTAVGDSTSPAWAINLTTPPGVVSLTASADSTGPSWQASTTVINGGGGTAFLNLIATSYEHRIPATFTQAASTGPALSIGNYDFTYAIYNGTVAQSSFTGPSPTFDASHIFASGQNWVPNEFAGGILTVLAIEAGLTQLFPIYATVLSNTATSATVAGWGIYPTPATGSYYIIQGPYKYEGQLRGVLNEPKFTAQINQGAGSLSLELDHFPSELSFGQLVQVQYPNGTTAGYWKYEQRAVKMAAKNSYMLTLLPLASELTDADYTANWSADATQLGVPGGAAPFNFPVLGAIPRTMHCTYGDIFSDGNNYSYAYNNARVKDTLDQAVLFGGAPPPPSTIGAWWWFCDRFGRTSLRNTSPIIHEVTVGREVTLGEWDDDILSLYNGQTVNGGTPLGSTTLAAAMNGVTLPHSTITVAALAAPGFVTTVPAGTAAYLLVQTTLGTSLVSYTGVSGLTFTGCGGGTGTMQTGGSVSAGALTASFFDVNPANPYSIPNFGRRTAPPYSDTSILDLASCYGLAKGLCAFSERVTARRKLTWNNYNYNLGYVRQPQPGDAVSIRQPSPDPASNQDMVTLGPYLILTVDEYGATNKFDVTIAADMVAAVGSQDPGMASTQAVSKLIQNAR